MAGNFIICLTTDVEGLQYGPDLLELSDLPYGGEYIEEISFEKDKERYNKAIEGFNEYVPLEWDTKLKTHYVDLSDEDTMRMMIKNYLTAVQKRAAKHLNRAKGNIKSGKLRDAIRDFWNAVDVIYPKDGLLVYYDYVKHMTDFCDDILLEYLYDEKLSNTKYYVHGVYYYKY